MRINLLLSLFFFLVAAPVLYAQPVNDECSGLIDLGVIPYCPDAEFFTNVNATETNIGANNFPTGCSGIGDITFVGRDVWFQFTTDATTVDYTITVIGMPDGMGSTSIMNPQIVVYRGDCVVDELSLLGCGKAANGETQMAIDILGLDPNTPYFIRINDWSATAGSNAGTFKLCVKELDPVYIMGEDTESTACIGTLFDSGGPDNDYSPNENNTFTVCPNQIFSCLSIDVTSFQTENGFDELNIYAGSTTGGPLLNTLTGNITNPFDIETNSPCVTFQFTSDGSVEQSGFEINWACNAAPCTGSSTDNPTVINSLPFNDDNGTTCDDASNFGSSPCQNDAFLNGPEYVYQYNSPGGICISVLIENAEPGTGVLILNGPPDDPNTDCVGVSAGGFIGSANLETPGVYYIVVANGAGCTDFDITIEEAECAFPPSLEDALCNPLNACEIMEGVPNQFTFEDGFQDVPVMVGVNAGCWFGVGVEADFVWFSVEIQEDGPFGFITSGGVPSDIDFNVWGPFSEEEVCETPAEVIDFITNNEPIRSSYAAFGVPTGLADIHPDFGYAVTDEYDCDGIGVENNDQFVRTVDGIAGEHYLVLLNDFGNVAGGIINIDWSTSGDGVLEVDLDQVEGADTVVCQGEAIQLNLPTWIDSIQWIDATNTLSCLDCLDPIATPENTTSYYAIVNGQCVSDTIKVDVFVYDVLLGADITVCQGEEVELSPNEIYPDVIFNWTGSNLSCNSCPITNVGTPTPGTFMYTIEQVAPTCILRDTIIITVLNQPAPAFDVIEDTGICIGANITLGDPNNDITNGYFWTSLPPGFTSSEANPTVSPTESTMYYVLVTNGPCPVPSFDSVFVSVNEEATINVANDMTVCQGDMVTLGNITPEPGAVYSWTPTDGLVDPSDPNTIATVNASTIYTLTGTIGLCTVTGSVAIDVIVINVDIDEPGDTTTICRGQPYNINASAAPANTSISWTTDNNTFTGSGPSVTVTPQTFTTYYATVSVPGCTRIDTFTILVDSLPDPMAIQALKDTVCMGESVVLFSETYAAGDFPDIDHQWSPTVGFNSPDSFYNAILTATETLLYIRTTTNGVCTETNSLLLTVIETTAINITPVNPTICVGESIQLNVDSPGVTDFEWSGPALSCVECPFPTVSPTSTANYSVVAEFNGCPVMASITVNVAPAPVSGIIEDTQICLGEDINLVNNPDANATYSWTSDPAGFVSSNPDTIVAPTTTTTYLLTISNANNCPPLMEEVTIEVVGGAAFANVADDISICLLPDTLVNVPLSATGNSGGGSYSWISNPGGVTSDEQNPNFSFTEPGTYTFEVTFTDFCGDLATETVSVTVFPGVDVTSLNINPEIPVDSTYYEGDVVSLSTSTNPVSGNYSYQWTSNGTPIVGEASVEVLLVDPNYNFAVTVTDANGCTDTDVLNNVPVEKPVWALPNAFTPNGDGNNDFFRLLRSGGGSKGIVIKTFQIWNRWGDLVFSGDDANGWNGTFKDKPLPSEVYIYRLVIERPSGEIEERKGDVTLIR